MVGSNGTMIAIRLVRSKLRKRDATTATGPEPNHHTNAVHPESTAANATMMQNNTTTATSPTMVVANNKKSKAFKVTTSSTTTTTATTNGVIEQQSHRQVQNNTEGSDYDQDCDHDQEKNAETVVHNGNNTFCNGTNNQTDNSKFIWQFPPPYPPPHALYNDQNNLVHALTPDRAGCAKGFRKNFGGRWRRLVKKKPESETCAIPPELKDQLKTIYVY